MPSKLVQLLFYDRVMGKVNANNIYAINRKQLFEIEARSILPVSDKMSPTGIMDYAGLICKLTNQLTFSLFCRRKQDRNIWALP